MKLSSLDFGTPGSRRSGLGAFLAILLPVMAILGLAMLPARGFAQECNPCVTLDAGELDGSICAGDSVSVLLKATNCGNVTGSVQITGPGGLDHSCPGLAPGDFCEFTHTFKTEPECPAGGEFVFRYDATLTTTACPETAHDDGFAKFACCTPRIEIDKTCPDTVASGETFQYKIVVTVPEGSCDLEDVRVRDCLCRGVTYAGNAVPPLIDAFAGEPCLNWDLGPMTAGQEIEITFDAKATEDCKGDFSCENFAEATGICGFARVTKEDRCTTEITCKRECEPCVTLDASEENPEICAGSDAIVILKATNCGTEKGRIEITGPENFLHVCESVDPGLTCEVRDTLETSAPCPPEGAYVYQYNASLTIDGCPTKAEDPGFAKFFCCTPEINVEKRCPEQVDNGDTFPYGIRVSVPEGACELEKIVVTDVLCGDVVYANNANIAPSEHPPVGESGTVVWNIGPIAPGGSVVITFDVTAKADCPTDGCENVVTVDGSCGEATVSDADTCETKIVCKEGTGCPRTVGFWTQQTQCAEGEGGNVKFSCAEMDLITGCVDDLTTIFNWTNDLAGFTAIIDPPTPMSKRDQAKRQFAGFVANHCAGILPVSANNGDLINLDLDLPITGCAFATTVGELLTYADNQLVALEAGDENNTAYTGFKDCLDHVNNHNGIPYDPKACHVGPSITAYVLELEAEEALSRAQDAAGQTVTGLEPSGVKGEILRPIPNPFSKTTSMAYAVSPASGERVEISIYNTSGQRVRGLVDEFKGAGRYSVTWDGKNDVGSSVPAGVYFYRVAIGAEHTVSRVVLVK